MCSQFYAHHVLKEKKYAHGVIEAILSFYRPDEYWNGIWAAPKWHSNQRCEDSGIVEIE